MGGQTSRTPLYIVCSPQPRVGRTLLARLLLDFFLMDDRPVAGFDFDAEPPSLVDFLPRHTEIADVTDIEGQMALFDRLIVPDRVAKVVDLAPAMFSPFFAVMEQIDFAAEARRRGIEPIALFIATPEAAAERAYAELLHELPELVLVPVYNEALSPGRRLRQDYPLTRQAALPLQIPMLAPLHYRHMQSPPFSFADFRGAPPERMPLEAYLEMLRWARRVFVEFRELELRMLLGDVQASLLRGA